MSTTYQPQDMTNYQPQLALPCDPKRIRSAPGAILTARSGRQFILGTRLSNGGSAAVFKARLVGHEGLVFAIRAITEHRRLERELAVLHAAIGNPYSLQYVDDGMWGNVPFIATELITEGEVGQFCSCNANARTDEVVAWIGAQVAACMERLVGVVHRDIKPENLMIRRGVNPSLGFVPGDSVGGLRVVVIDFGIVSASGVAADVQVKVTRTAQAMGSVAFIAPEVCIGGARDVGVQADMYSLGCTLYNLRADVQPFPDHDTYQQTMQDHISAAIPEHPEIVGKMRRLIRRLMSKHAYERHSSWTEVRVECENIAGAKVDL